jgi:alpha-amylase
MWCRYVARVGDRLTVKLGDRYDMGDLVSQECDSWSMETFGHGYAVWVLGADD